MISPPDLRAYVIEPVLAHLGAAYATEAAVRLLLGTAAAESNMGQYLNQIGRGPAASIYQIERPTYEWTLTTVMQRWPDLHRRALEFCLPVGCPDDFVEMKGNLYWATAVCRLVYWWRPDPLPAPDDVAGMSSYWKRHYNTEAGAGTRSMFAKRFRDLVLPYTQEA